MIKPADSPHVKKPVDADQQCGDGVNADNQGFHGCEAEITRPAHDKNDAGQYEA